MVGTKGVARRDLQYVETLGLKWTPEQRDQYLDNVKVVDITRLEEPYPVNDYFTAGTPKAKKQWDAFWHNKPLCDRRNNKGKRRQILNLDTSRLQYIIKQDESVMFRDADTKELVLVVLRDFVPDEDVRETMVGVGNEILKYRRDDRREDPGMLVHFGYTCGSRHAPQIQMATPSVRLNSQKNRDREKTLNVKAQGLAGVLWNMMKSRMPAEVIDAYNDMIDEHDLPRMDMMRDDGTFSFRIDGKAVTFRGLELPPPSAMSAINYARYTHKEHNGNNWVVAFTSSAPRSPARGGNFYLASYGIMMEPATNTVSAWHPLDYHGTTLYEMAEEQGKIGKRHGHALRLDGDMNTGIIFEVSRAMKNARLRSNWLDDRGKAVPAAKLIRRAERISKQTRYGLRPPRLLL